MGFDIKGTPTDVVKVAATQVEVLPEPNVKAEALAKPEAGEEPKEQ